MRLIVASLSLLMLCGCAAGDAPGDSVAGRLLSQDAADCGAQANAALQRDEAIDADITSTLSNDWQAAGTLGVREQRMRDDDLGRADAIVATCMPGERYLPGHARE